ncbi:hypothetical protein KUCAC02_028775, partial [Chaenocephalus aceratus]
RLTPAKALSPPVGVYNDQRCALELLRRTTGVKKSHLASLQCALLATTNNVPHQRNSFFHNKELMEVPGPGEHE